MNQCQMNEKPVRRKTAFIWSADGLWIHWLTSCSAQMTFSSWVKGGCFHEYKEKGFVPSDIEWEFERQPDATIIGVLGIMGQELYPYVEAAIKQYTEETGDKNVTYLMFDNQSEADGIAADWHPTESTHAKASAKLVEKIKEVMGW